MQAPASDEAPLQILITVSPEFIMKAIHNKMTINNDGFALLNETAPIVEETAPIVEETAPTTVAVESVATAPLPSLPRRTMDTYFTAIPKKTAATIIDAAGGRGFKRKTFDAPLAPRTAPIGAADPDAYLLVEDDSDDPDGDTMMLEDREPTITKAEKRQTTRNTAARRRTAAKKDKDIATNAKLKSYTAMFQAQCKEIRELEEANHKLVQEISLFTN